jgi:hypothetical protein
MSAQLPIGNGTIQLVTRKLRSQVLLFSLAMAVLLIGLAQLLDLPPWAVVIALLVIFTLALSGYLFIEQRQQPLKAAPKAQGRQLRASAGKLSNPEAAFSVSVSTAPTSPRPLPSGGRDIAVRDSREPAQYRRGDKVTVRFQAGHDCYLTLLNIGSSGRLTILFPNALHRDNFITAGRVYEIPGPGDDFDFELQGPPGTEKLKAVATQTRVELLESSFSPDGSLFRSVPAAEGARDLAMIQRSVTRLPPRQWAEAECEFNVK